ncbi:MAG: 16S rRNA (uracil(1498)-N(3))-methyltransferase [Proteobacteria bacterium]|nr:16S rRNA (uracil(1498)-N(3))-methyltransferase [Pseudomonadota bacterium]
MNLILLFDDDFIKAGNSVRLKDHRLRHVIDVHQASEGDELTVGLLNGKMGVGHLTFLSPEAMEMDVTLNVEPPPSLPLTLIMALPRPKVLKRVLRTISAMGVKRLFLINSWRVEKSYWQSPALEEEKIREQLVLGLEQAKDTVLPEVMLRRLFKAFVEDELPGLIKDSMSLVAHPIADALCPRDVRQPVTLAIGPEGGFIPYEIEKLEACGFKTVNLGERILTVETAVPVLLARLF